MKTDEIKYDGCCGILEWGQTNTPSVYTNLLYEINVNRTAHVRWSMYTQSESNQYWYDR